MAAKPQRITVAAEINAPLEKVWNAWSNPEAIKQWNQASADWHTTEAENDLSEGGQFRYHMAAKDGSAGFDLKGTYVAIDEFEYIEYELEDGRQVGISFMEDNGITNVTETFEAENQHSPELQQQGWQAIMNSFKQFVENN
ncbi:MAG: hypothetical protein RLZZ42_1403 [Bacteroidota bacterium]